MLFVDFIGKMVLEDQTSTDEWDQYIAQLISDPGMRAEALESVKDDPEQYSLAMDVLSIITSVSEPDAEFDGMLFETAKELELHYSLGLLYACGIGVEPDRDIAIQHLTQDPMMNRYYGPIRDNRYLLQCMSFDSCMEVVDLLNDESDLSQAGSLFMHCIGNGQLFSAEVLWNGMLRYISQGNISETCMFLERFDFTKYRVDHRLWDAVGRALCANMVLDPMEDDDRHELDYLMGFREDHIPNRMTLSDFVRWMCSGHWTNVSDIGQLGYENERTERLEAILPSRIIDGILTSEPFSIGTTISDDGDVLNSAYKGDPESQYRVGRKCYIEGQMDDAMFWFEMSAQGFNIDAMRELVRMLDEDDPRFQFWTSIISQEERYARGHVSEDDMIDLVIGSSPTEDLACCCDMGSEEDGDYVIEEVYDEDEQPADRDDSSGLTGFLMKRLRRSRGS